MFAKGGVSLRVSELIKYLEKNGVRLIEHGGRHNKYIGINGNTFPISRDKNKDYGKNMVEKIKKQAGLK